MQNHNAQESTHASFKWYEKEITGLFLFTTNVVQYFIFFSMINWFSSFLFSFFLLHINVIYLGYFSKMKEIMNVNRRIIFLVSKICYDKIDDYGQLCTFSPNYWPWSVWKVLFIWFYISDRLLGCQEQPLLERYAYNFNMIASLSFVNTICLWKPHTFQWQNLEERDINIWLPLQKSIFLCDYLAKSDGVFSFHRVVKKNSHSFIIRFDFSDSIKGSFAIDTQMPIVIFFLDNRYNIPPLNLIKIRRADMQ